MEVPDKSEQTVESSGDGISRRNVLRTVGAGAVAGTGMIAATGSASAHDLNCVRFCGCGRLVAYGKKLTGSYDVLVAKEGGPGPATLSKATASGQGNGIVFVQRGRGKILAINVEGDIWVNPNTCAQNVFEDHGGVASTLQDEFGTSDHMTGKKGHCHPPMDHPHDHC